MPRRPAYNSRERGRAQLISEAALGLEAPKHKTQCRTALPLPHRSHYAARALSFWLIRGRGRAHRSACRRSRTVRGGVTGRPPAPNRTRFRPPLVHGRASEWAAARARGRVSRYVCRRACPAAVGLRTGTCDERMQRVRTACHCSGPVLEGPVALHGPRKAVGPLAQEGTGFQRASNMGRGVDRAMVMQRRAYPTHRKSHALDTAALGPGRSLIRTKKKENIHSVMFGR